MYLKTVNELANENIPVPISALANRLGVSTVSATEMVHRLRAEGLLEHTPYKGVNLTGEGDLQARLLIRRHRLWECLMVDKLNISWQLAHDYACRLEHATDAEVTEALAVFLGEPTTCPHGNPIPSADGVMPYVVGQPLHTTKPGDEGIIMRIHPESSLLLDYLAGRHILPGRPILVEEIAPFNGPLMVRIGEETHALGQEIASHIFVKLDNEDNREADHG